MTEQRGLTMIDDEQFIQQHFKHKALFWSGENWGPRQNAKLYTMVDVHDIFIRQFEGEWKRVRKTLVDAPALEADALPDNDPDKYCTHAGEKKVRAGHYLTESLIKMINDEHTKTRIPRSVILELWARRGINYYKNHGEF